MDLPAIDQNVCGSWTEQQQDFYNKLPFYLLQAQAEYRKYWVTWKKLFNSVPWKPNNGDTMRRVMAEPAPVLRQMAFPNRINTTPLTDVVNYRERKLDSVIRWQDFRSPHFNFLPEFQDFMKHIDKTSENINKQITVFEDCFYRTHAFHRAPYIWIAGAGLQSAPTGDGSADGSTGKTDAWLQAQFATLAGIPDGTLTFQELFKVLNAGEQEVGMTPYEGTGMPKSDSNPLDQKFCLICSPEDWNNFVDDPWPKENRPLNMNIVTDNFRGDLWGRITCRLERYPFRWKLDANFAGTMPDPEVVELNPDREDFGRTKPNPEFARASISPVGCAFLIGGSAGDVIDVGPPPPEFTRELDQGAAIKMNWNGKAYLTKEFLVPCMDSNGNTFYDANSFGRYLRSQATVSCGMSLINSFNVLPILFKRRIGVTTVTA